MQFLEKEITFKHLLLSTVFKHKKLFTVFYYNCKSLEKKKKIINQGREAGGVFRNEEYMNENIFVVLLYVFLNLNR